MKFHNFIFDKRLRSFATAEELNIQRTEGDFLFTDNDGNRVENKLKERPVEIFGIAGIQDWIEFLSSSHTLTGHSVMKNVDPLTVRKLMGAIEHRNCLDLFPSAEGSFTDALRSPDSSQN